MGECGSGKSTFLNYLCNCLMKNKPSNLVSFTTTSAHLNNKKEKMKAHTQECKIWGPFEYNKINYHIIDTPGLADTDGLEKDAKNLDGILQFVSNCDSIIGIILVVNGTASRFTSNLKLVFSKLKSSLPDEVLENACVVFTNCALASDRNFKIEMIDFLKDPKFIYVQNSYKFGQEYDLDSEEFEEQKSRWKKSMKRIEYLMRFFDGKEEIITTAFNNLRISKEGLKMELTKCYTEIQTLGVNEYVLQSRTEQIFYLCQTLQSICSGYNLVQELLVEIEIMKTHKACATTLAEAEKWNKCIKGVEIVIKYYEQ